MQVGAVVISIVGSWLLLFYLRVSVAFIGPIEPDNIGTPGQWINELARAATESVNLVLQAALALAAALCAAIVAAWRRNRLWLMSGVMSALPLAIGLLLVSGVGLRTLDAVSAEAESASVKTEVNAEAESSSEPQAPPPLLPSTEDTESSMRQLIELTSNAAGGSLADASGNKQTPDAIAIASEPCMDELADMSGIRSEAVFTVSNAPDGATLAAVASSWKAAGYDLRNSQRSEMTYSYGYGAITFASVNDSETIDGLTSRPHDRALHCSIEPNQTEHSQFSHDPTNGANGSLKCD
jgi:hypothetical protein